MSRGVCDSVVTRLGPLLGGVQYAVQAQGDAQEMILHELAAIREELERDREKRRQAEGQRAEQLSELTARSANDRWHALPWRRRAFTRRPGPRRRY
jgi:hypothetical protein